MEIYDFWTRSGEWLEVMTNSVRKFLNQIISRPNDSTRTYTLFYVGIDNRWDAFILILSIHIKFTFQSLITAPLTRFYGQLTNCGHVKKYGNTSSRSIDLSLRSFFLYEDVNLIFSLIVSIFLSSVIVDFNQATSFVAAKSVYCLLSASSTDAFLVFLIPFLWRKFFIPNTSQPALFLASYSNSYS